eukprot:Gb_14752 [translate_table: standard]
MLRPTKLAVVVAGNPVGLVDGVNTIGMLLTSSTVNIDAGYLGIPAEDEGRDPDSFFTACLGTRQRFRCGGVLDGQMHVINYYNEGLGDGWSLGCSTTSATSICNM